MNFKIKKRQKIKSLYKTIHIKKPLAKEIEELAKKEHTSFNNVVISMIEHVLTTTKKSK